MREQTFQRLLKPHSCGASWRDKKLPAGGTQPKVSTGLSIKRPHTKHFFLQLPRAEKIRLISGTVLGYQAHCFLENYSIRPLSFSSSSMSVPRVFLTRSFSISFSPKDRGAWEMGFLSMA